MPPLDEPRSTQEFEALIEYLKNNRGFDFSGYKRSSLQRRMGKRMQTLRIERYSDYLDYLEVHPEEFIQLFNTILINVTGFFRDTAAWEFLAAEVILRLIAGKQPHEPIRVWSAGCASGEEAYTLAIVLAEALGLESFRQRVKIYATDVDEEALVQARQASYSARDLQPVSPELRANTLRKSAIASYFDPTCAGPSSLAATTSSRMRPSRAGPARVPQHAYVFQRRDPIPHPGPLPFRPQ